MMHQKALLFSDAVIASKILSTDSPKTQKSLGRKVRNFDQGTWEKERERIVEEGTWLKFRFGGDKGELGREGLSLGERLLSTGARELVEASPRDSIWGIGFHERWADSMREEWGLNLLGQALMKVRDKLRAEGVGNGKEIVKDDEGIDRENEVEIEKDRRKDL